MLRQAWDEIANKANCFPGGARWPAKAADLRKALDPRYELLRVVCKATSTSESSAKSRRPLQLQSAVVDHCFQLELRFDLQPSGCGVNFQGPHFRGYRLQAGKVKLRR